MCYPKVIMMLLMLVGWGICCTFLLIRYRVTVTQTIR